MRLALTIAATIIVVALLALSIYIAIDAKKHIDKSFEYQQMYRRAVNCSATSIVNCTNTMLIDIVASAQELLLGVVELVVATLILLIAFRAAIAFTKMISDPEMCEH